MSKKIDYADVEAPLTDAEIQRMLDQAARNEQLPKWERVDPKTLVVRRKNKASGAPKITDSDMNDVVAMFEAGKTNRQIADHYGYHCTSTVSRMRHAWESGDISKEFRARG